MNVYDKIELKIGSAKTHLGMPISKEILILVLNEVIKFIILK